MEAVGRSRSEPKEERALEQADSSSVAIHTLALTASNQLLRTESSCQQCVKKAKQAMQMLNFGLEAKIIHMNPDTSARVPVFTKPSSDYEKAPVT